MKKNILNVMIIISFLFIFYRFAEATGSYSSIKTKEPQEETLPAMAEEMIREMQRLRLYRYQRYKEEAVPDLFYQILSASMAEKGTAKEYTKEEIYMTDMPLIFKTILCGDFDDIPWGEGLGDEIEVYYSAYEKKDLWQFTLRDLDEDGRNELVIRDEDGHVLCFFEQYGDVETSTGMIYYCTMEEGDWYSATKLLERERCYSVFYLYNGEKVRISSREYESGNYSLDIEVCRSIYRKANYNQRKGQIQIIYDTEDNMEKEGLYYYIDDENVTKEEFEEWLYQQIWMEMIPIEEWGVVPERISETETMVEYTLDQETDESFYDAYLKKIWIVDQEERDMEDASFVITEIRNGEIEGYLCTHGEIETYYWHELSAEGSSFMSFHGMVSEGKAVSSFECEGDQEEFVIQFCENDRIQASLKCEETGMYKSYLFRPYNISDMEDFTDTSSTELYLTSWGEVSLVWGIANSRHPFPQAYMVNDKNDILYGFACGINGSKVWDIFVRDMNGDGLEDIMTVACIGEEPGDYRNAVIFYQLEDGTFQRKAPEWDRSESLPERYYGNYEIVRFCPTDDGEEILGKEAVESMLGRTVVMQEDLLITYDLESRAGVRKDREIVQGADAVYEFYEASGSVWREAQPETLGYGGIRDEILRGAVGDEYYEKIDGVITASGTQRIYTLQGGQEMILYSLVTGQYFILSKIE